LFIVAKWECSACGWVYDEEKEGTKFEDLPDDYVCPVCGVDKSFFTKISD
jgi:rubredoxin